MTSHHFLFCMFKAVLMRCGFTHFWVSCLTDANGAGGWMVFHTDGYL